MTNHPSEILDALPMAVIEIDEHDEIQYLNTSAKALLWGDAEQSLQQPTALSRYFATQEILGLVGAYVAAENCLTQTNVLLLDANGNTLSHAVTGARLTTPSGQSRAILVAQRNSQLQEELAESSRWAAAEQNRADDLSRTRDALQQSHDRLREMQAQLIQASRLAGMAEIASGAIHNIGNVLNGVNVGVKLARDKLGVSRMSKFSRLSAALKQHLGLPESERDSTRLAGFLNYFDELVQAVEKDRTSLLESLDSVLQKVEHIKNVVGSQQSHARSGGVTEVVRLKEIVGQALDLQRTSRSAEIEVVQDLGEIDEVELDRHNLLQVLVNLITNAENSMIENDTPEKRVSIVAKKIPGNCFEIQVRDTGMGIDKSIAERIFAHGFTTRRNGNGFGLHNAALLVKKMQGQMGVTSEGTGAGATFWIRLPLCAQRSAA